jgi:hypothetical protein
LARRTDQRIAARLCDPGGDGLGDRRDRRRRGFGEIRKGLPPRFAFNFLLEQAVQTVDFGEGSD